MELLRSKNETMTKTLDMSLDDIVRSTNTRRRGRGRSFVPGPTLRFQFKNRTPFRPTPITKDMFVGQTSSLLETATKVYISNLYYGVSNEDIKELFSEVGDLKHYGVHYDRSGRSKGTAEVVFSRRPDAVAAVKKFNNVQLDGRPMRLEIVGAKAVVPRPANGFLRNNRVDQRRVQGRGGGMRRSQRGGRGFVRGRGWGRGQKEKLSADDLDADLQKYHAEAMQIN